MTVTYSANAEELRKRFGLRDGQFFAYNVYKNLFWQLCDTNRMTESWFGFGDLTAQQTFDIQDRLEPGEFFQGWNEHHDTQWQQRLGPMIRIERTDIKMAIDIPNRVPQFPDDLGADTVCDGMLGGQGDE